MGDSEVKEIVFYDRTASDITFEQKFERDEALVELAKSRFGDNGFKVVGRYYDFGYAGTSLDRPELERMFSDLENSNWKYVLVLDNKRLSRSLTQNSFIARTLIKQGKTTVMELSVDGEKTMFESVPQNKIGLIQDLLN